MPILSGGRLFLVEGLFDRRMSGGRSLGQDADVADLASLVLIRFFFFFGGAIAL